MKEKTFREYLCDCQFEEIWEFLSEYFGEPQPMKAAYADYYEKLKALPGSHSLHLSHRKNMTMIYHIILQFLNQMMVAH